MFFKTASLQELLVYRLFNLQSSPLLPFLQEMVGIYKCVEDMLILIIDLSSNLLELDIKAIESSLTNNRKIRSLDFDGALFLAFKHINVQMDANEVAETPSFIDLKLGVHTYAPNAPPEKVLSQEEKARNSTTSSHGIRLMGAVLDAELQGKEPKLLTKKFGRSCKYSDILMTILHLVVNKREMDALIEKLKRLADAMRQEDVYMSGSSLLIYRKSDGIGVFLIDFSHSYSQEHIAELLIASKEVLQTTKSTAIAEHVYSLSEDLLSYWNSSQILSSSSL